MQTPVLFFELDAVQKFHELVEFLNVGGVKLELGIEGRSQAAEFYPVLF